MKYRGENSNISVNEMVYLREYRGRWLNKARRFHRYGKLETTARF
jgi:hypothetical protein